MSLKFWQKLPTGDHQIKNKNPEKVNGIWLNFEINKCLYLLLLSLSCYSITPRYTNTWNCQQSSQTDFIGLNFILYVHINFAFGSMMTKCQVIQDVIFSMKVFKINISVHFNWETFLSWAIHWNCIEHDLLPGLSNFVVNCFCYWTTESPSTLSLKRYHNLLIGKQPYMPIWLMKVLQTYWSAH